MKRNLKYIDFEGKLGNLVFYMLNGKQVVRQIGVVSKQRRKKSAEFARVRETMEEFGNASRVGKMIRSAMVPFDKEFGDVYVSGRLNGAMKKIIGMGNGKKGKRDFEPVEYGYLLGDFEMDEKKRFENYFKTDFEIAVSGDKKKVEGTFELNNGAVKWTKGADYYELIFGSCYVSSYKVGSKNGMYEAIDAKNNGLCVWTKSEKIKQNETMSLSLMLDFEVSGTVKASTAILIFVGIRFWQKKNGLFYELKNTKGMMLKFVS